MLESLLNVHLVLAPVKGQGLKFSAHCSVQPCCWQCWEGVAGWHMPVAKKHSWENRSVREQQISHIPSVQESNVQRWWKDKPGSEFKGHTWRFHTGVKQGGGDVVEMSRQSGGCKVEIRNGHMQNTEEGVAEPLSCFFLLVIGYIICLFHCFTVWCFGLTALVHFKWINVSFSLV